MKSNNTNITLILFIWLAIAALINPFGFSNFGDDFSYNWVVRNWIETGSLKITDWTSMILIGHVSLGFIWSKLFGYSYENIRFLMLFLGFLSHLGFYKLLFINYKDSKQSFWISLLFISQPIYLLYSSHFATDVTWYCFIIWSFYFLNKYFIHGKNTDYLIGSLFLIYSGTIRELSLIFAFVFILISIKQKKNLILSILPFIIILTIFFSWRYWLENYNGMPLLMGLGKEQLINNLANPLSLIKSLAVNSIKISIYISFIYLLLDKSLVKILSILSISLLGSYFFSDIFYKRTFYEFFSSVIPYGFEIGDIHKSDTAYLIKTGKFTAFFIITAGVLNFILNLKIIKSKLFNFKENIFTFNKLTFAFYSLFLLNLFSYIRYYFTSISLFLVIYNKKVYYHSKMIIVLLLILSSLIVRDNYNIVRKQEEIIEISKNKFQVSKEELDAGFDYGARNFFDMRKTQPDTLNWYWIKGDRYLIRSGLADGYTPIYKDSLQRIIPPITQYFYILKEKY